jgi:hypothetical protein
MKIHVWVAALALALGGSAFAQTNASPSKDPVATPRIDQREANQEKRIDQGVTSGQLTKREAARLRAGEDRIARAEARAKADGTVTAKERKHLEKMENAESKKIAHEKHDKQKDMNHDGKRDHAQHAGAAKHTSKK